MLLVPRQLSRSGMTGKVPYYGGRFSPTQAYAASHPSAPAPDRPGSSRSTVAGPPAPAPPAESPETPEADTQAALRQLRDSGVLTSEEYDDLLTRTNR
jgi:hypothetical protein